jgi:hypothetical protein
MIESRWKLESDAAESGKESESAISQIQTVVLHWANDIDQVALVRYRQLLDEGLDLRLVMKNGNLLDYDTLLGPIEPSLP